MTYIEHVAIWCVDLEKMRSFYIQYFNVSSSALYHNPAKEFYSYFLSFEKGMRLELMHKPGIPANISDVFAEYRGIIHFAISVGSKERVNALTAQLKNDRHTVISQPRTTGDGYYESVVLDPENNRIEITV